MAYVALEKSLVGGKEVDSSSYREPEPKGETMQLRRDTTWIY